MLVLIDGTHALHRSMHVSGNRDLSTEGGEFTGGALGVMSSLSFALRELQPTKAVFVWDSAHSARRKELFPEYKTRASSRDDDPTWDSDFATATAQLNRLLPLLGVGTLSVPGKEGDDVIARAVRAWRKKSPRRGVVIVTEDKDFFQLVRTKVSVYRPIRGVWVRSENFYEITEGVLPEEWVLLRAIEGDKSDAIGGVPQVGPKTVLELFNLIRTQRRIERQDPSPVTLDVLVAASRESAGKRAGRIAAERSIIERNIQLMDLAQERFRKSEGKLIRRALKEPHRLDRVAFTAAIRELEMAELESRLDEFVPSFRRLR